MLSTYGDTYEFKRTYLAWDQVFHREYPTVFKANYRRGQCYIDRRAAEDELERNLVREQKLGKLSRDYQTMVDFFAGTNTNISFVPDFDSQLAQLQEDKAAIEERIVKDNRILDRAVQEIGSKTFTCPEVSSYVVLTQQVENGDISVVGANAKIEDCTNIMTRIPMYMARLSAQGNRRHSTMGPTDLKLAIKMHGAVVHYMKKYSDIEGSENFSMFGAMMVKDILIQYLVFKNVDSFERTPEFIQLKKIVEKSLGKFNEEEYLRKGSTSTGSNVASRNNQSKTTIQWKNGKIRGVAIGLFVLVVLASIFIGSRYAIKHIYWNDIEKKYVISEEQLAEAKESDDVIITTDVYGDARNLILSDEMGDDERYQSIFDFVWYMRMKSIEEYGESKANHDAYKYTVCTPNWNEKEKYIRIDGYDGSLEPFEMTNIDVPLDIDGIPVMEIGQYAFSGINKKDIKLPISVVAIGTNAFSNAKQLESVSGADWLMKIGYGCFDGCDNILSINLGDYVGLQYIGDYAFRGCKKLQTITLVGKTVFKSTYFGINVFDGDTLLECVILPENLDLLRRDAFANNSSLRKVISIGDANSKTDEIEAMGDVIYVNCDIDPEAFSGCSLITKVILGEKVQNIGMYAFLNCSNLKEVVFNEVKVGDGNTIGMYAFSNTALESVEIPGSYVNIMTSAFSGNNNLKKFVLNNNTDGTKQEIANSVFHGDENLTEAYISSNCVNVDGWTFDGKKGLLGATIYSNSPDVRELYEKTKGTSNEFILYDWKE